MTPTFERETMQIKSIVAGAAIALIATVGADSAADQFAVLDGVTTQPMNAVELAQIRGIGVEFPEKETLINSNIITIEDVDEGTGDDIVPLEPVGVDALEQPTGTSKIEITSTSPFFSLRSISIITR